MRWFEAELGALASLPDTAALGSGQAKFVVAGAIVQACGRHDFAVTLRACVGGATGVVRAEGMGYAQACSVVGLKEVGCGSGEMETAKNLGRTLEVRTRHADGNKRQYVRHGHRHRVHLKFAVHPQTRTKNLTLLPTQSNWATLSRLRLEACKARSLWVGSKCEGLSQPRKTQSDNAEESPTSEARLRAAR